MSVEEPEEELVIDAANLIVDALTAQFAILHVEGDTFIESGVEKPNPLRGEAMLDMPAGMIELKRTLRPILSRLLREAKIAAHKWDLRLMAKSNQNIPLQIRDRITELRERKG